MESKDELEEIDIKNCTCYYFDDLTKDIDIYSVDILFYEKSYETYKNILVTTFRTKMQLAQNHCVLGLIK